MAKKELNYNEAYLHLKKLTADIQNGKISIEKLPEEIRRAKDLLNYCQSVLRNIEFELDGNTTEEE